MRFLRIAKINSEQEKPNSTDRKNYFPQNTNNVHLQKQSVRRKTCMQLTKEKGSVCSVYCNKTTFLVMKSSYFSKDNRWIHNLYSCNSALSSKETIIPSWYRAAIRQPTDKSRRGSTQQSFIRGGSAPKSKDLTFHILRIPFLTEKESLLYTLLLANGTGPLSYT